jgi:nanoRNase/pAp phosphatase (c-di-AMP/oligoRNAs hydrolase)
MYNKNQATSNSQPLDTTKKERYGTLWNTVVLKKFRDEREMLLPLSTHPDPDEYGSLIALALARQSARLQTTLYIPEDAWKKVPQYFKDIIMEEQLRLSHTVPERLPAVCFVDTANPSLYDPAVAAKLDRDTVVFDFDHHQGTGNHHLEQALHINNNMYKSAGGMIGEMFLKDFHLVFPRLEKSKNLARALSGAIVSDTNKFRLQGTTEARHIADQFITRTGMGYEEIFDAVHQYSKDDAALCQVLESRVQEREIAIKGKKTKVCFLEVTAADLAPYKGLMNWRYKLVDNLGFDHGYSVVCVAFPGRDGLRGSIRAFGPAEGTMDFKKVAQLYDDNGGGHPGAVGFSFVKEKYTPDQLLKQLQEIAPDK